MLSVDLDSTQASSSSSGESANSVPVPTPSPPRTSPRPPTPVRRILRRKIGVAGSRSALCQDDRTELFTRLVNEEIEIQTNAPPGCYAAPKSGDLLLWTAVIEGPAGTPYEGGTFFCNIHITTRYPLAPPKVEFLTRIYHCNVNAQGDVCLDMLNDKWKPTMSVNTVLMAV
ncbi:ubiquitin--protein ligase, partial [Oesophagostomum dentatum]